MPKKIKWSDFQVAIFGAVLQILTRKRDLVVLARAGTGKTTTMVEAIVRWCRDSERRPRDNALLCAFNKKVQEELAGRLKAAGLPWEQAKAQTLHSVGLAAIRRADRKVRVESSKGKKIARKLAAEYHDSGRPRIASLAGKVASLAGKAKATLTDPDDEGAMRDLCNRFQIVDHGAEQRPVIRLARRAMALARENAREVDFDDMIWLPHELGLKPWTHNLVVVDEAQDMNPAQLWLARQAVKRGGRLVAVGDDRQAIYGWRGADSEFLDRMVRELNADTLPLPRTYRCGHAIVAEAQKLVPDYEAADSNVAGEVLERSDGVGILADVEPGDFVLSRTNAPLLGLALQLIKAKVPAQIQGRDVIGQIAGLVHRSECGDTQCLRDWIEQYRAREVSRLRDEDADEAVIEQVSDLCECIRVLSYERETCEDLVAYLGEIFSDQDDAGVVTLSTVHRAKGLERDRVWLLCDTFRRHGGQEDNVLYVAITRAISTLVYVTGLDSAPE